MALAQQNNASLEPKQYTQLLSTIIFTVVYIGSLFSDLLCLLSTLYYKSMIYIGSDHAGFDLKASLKQWLSDQGRAYSDLGTKQADVCDYPDFAFPVAKRVVASPGDLGVLICGSGVGMAIAAGKVRGARPALAWMPDIAKQARAHDDANILVLPARFMDANLAIDCL